MEGRGKGVFENLVEKGKERGIITTRKQNQWREKSQKLMIDNIEMQLGMADKIWMYSLLEKIWSRAQMEDWT